MNRTKISHVMAPDTLAPAGVAAELSGIWRLKGSAVVLAAVTVCALHAQTPSLSVLYTFTGGPNGSRPSGLVENTSGTFFGTTNFGGAPDCAGDRYNCGGVFQLVSATGAESFLHVFSVPSEGSGFQIGVIQDSKGNLYGVTTNGGNASDSGVVYRIDPAGGETVLHIFDRVQRFQDGWFPRGVVGDKAGNLYGSTLSGGSVNCEDGCGVIFRITAVQNRTGLGRVLLKAKALRAWKRGFQMGVSHFHV